MVTSSRLLHSPTAPLSLSLHRVPHRRLFVRRRESVRARVRLLARLDVHLRVTLARALGQRYKRRRRDDDATARCERARFHDASRRTVACTRWTSRVTPRAPSISTTNFNGFGRSRAALALARARLSSTPRAMTRPTASYWISRDGADDGAASTSDIARGDARRRVRPRGDVCGDARAEETLDARETRRGEKEPGE